MAHQAVNDGYVIAELTSVKMFAFPKTGGVSATVTAEAALAASLLAFLKTGFVEGRYALVDSGTNQSAYPLGEIPEDAAPIPLMRPTDFIHPVGAPVRLLVEHHLGYIEDGGVSFGGSSSQTSIGAANAAGPIFTSKPRMGDMTCSWGERAASLEILALAYGIDLSRVVGAGTSTDPRRLMTHPNVLFEMRHFFFLLEGPLANGTIRRRAIFNPTITANISGAFGALNAPMVVPISCTYTHHLDWDAAA